MKVLAIVGAGGHGNVVAETAKLMGWKKFFFYDDNENIRFDKKNYRGVLNSIFNDDEKISEIIIAIGDNNIRVNIYNILKKKFKNKFAKIIHPKSIIAKSVKIEGNCFIGTNTVINSNSYIYHSSIINTSVTLDHDCICNYGVHLSPGVIIGGKVVIKNKTWIGLGSKIINNIKIGSNVIIGAGSVVVKNIKDNKRVMGVPAREK